MDGIKREIMFEKDWNQPCVHIDVPVPYEEDYQMKMLRYNEIDGLLRVSGIGREEESRYTYQTRGGISLEKKYENKNIEKETITAFIEQFMGVVDAVRNHMLDPDCLLLEARICVCERRKIWVLLSPGKTEESVQVFS